MITDRQRWLALRIAILFSVALIAFAVWRQNVKKEPVGAKNEPAEIVYHLLADEMVTDTENDPVFFFWSGNLYAKHKNYSKIIGLGRPVVPILILELRGGDNTYQTDMLDKILPSIDLGNLYNQPDYKNDSHLHRDLWFRWWDEFGSEQRWE